MSEVSAHRARRDDLETSMSKLVSALLAVAEESLAEDTLQTQKDKPQGVAVGPAVPLVARSKTPEPGANGRGGDPIQSEPGGGTKRRTA
jgi:hypothetical protein